MDKVPFKVYVDGKPNVMFSSNPSSDIQSDACFGCEINRSGHNPGAKYDAEGVGGVLNIVMNNADGKAKTKLNGYNGSIAATISNKGYRGSTFLSGQQGKLTYSANLMGFKR